MDRTKEPARVDIIIDRLVLEGAGPVDGERVRLQLQRELARLVREHGVPAPAPAPGVGPVPALGATGASGRTEIDGTALARAIYAEIGR